MAFTVLYDVDTPSAPSCHGTRRITCLYIVFHTIYRTLSKMATPFTESQIRGTYSPSLREHPGWQALESILTTAEFMHQCTGS